MDSYFPDISLHSHTIYKLDDSVFQKNRESGSCGEVLKMKNKNLKLGIVVMVCILVACIAWFFVLAVNENKAQEIAQQYLKFSKSFKEQHPMP